MQLPEDCRCSLSVCVCVDWSFVPISEKHIFCLFVHLLIRLSELLIYVYLFIYLIVCFEFFISLHFRVHLMLLVQGLNCKNDCCRLANRNMQAPSGYCNPVSLLFTVQYFIHILRMV